MKLSIKYFLPTIFLLIGIGLYTRTKPPYSVQHNDIQTFVVVGSSASGQSVINELSSLIKKGTVSSKSRIIWISADKNAPYKRTNLADYIVDQKNLSRNKNQQSFISYHFNTRITSINKNSKNIELDNGQTVAYDKLFLGLGTTPLTLNIPGINTKGVSQYFTLEDVATIKERLHLGRPIRAVVLGSGLCSIECADALNKCGASVTVVTKSNNLLNRKISPQDATYIENAMIKSGVRYHRNATITQVIEKNNNITGVLLSDKTELPADLLVYAIGAKFNSSIAKNAGLTLLNEGILVNDYLCTSDPHIYAAGDCVVLKDRITGSLVHSEKWNDAKDQGVIAARAMAGLLVNPYEGTVICSLTKAFGIRFVFSVPLNNPESYDVVIREEKDGSYYKLFFQDKKLKGFFCFNIPVTKILTLRKALIDQKELTPDSLIDSSFLNDTFTIIT